MDRAGSGLNLARVEYPRRGNTNLEAAGINGEKRFGDVSGRTQTVPATKAAGRILIRERKPAPLGAVNRPPAGRFGSSVVG